MAGNGRLCYVAVPDRDQGSLGAPAPAPPVPTMLARIIPAQIRPEGLSGAHHRPLARARQRLSRANRSDRVLREGLEFMDDEIRAAFVLPDLLELPVDEVAAVLETSPQDVGRRIHRARLMLHGLLARL